MLPSPSSPVAPATTGFWARLRQHGDAPALLGPDGSRVSYAALADRVEERARELGTTRRLVLLEGRADPETVVTHLAALQGGHPVLLVPGERPEALEALVAAYDPDVVARGAALEQRRPGTRHALHPDLALLLSTSGSTGSPKLVRLSVGNVAANADQIATALGLRATDVAPTALPLSYCYGLSVLHAHLAAGAAVLLTDLSVVDPCFWEACRTVGATTLAGVPYTFDLLERDGFDRDDLPTLRLVTQAGGRLPADRVRAWAERGRRDGFDLVVMYGQTEATARMAVGDPELARSRPDAVGRAVPDGTFTLDPATGELCFSGPNVMMGYATTPADLARGDETTTLRTGDLAHVDEDGVVTLHGRASRFAKVNGLRVDLDRVEQDLASGPVPGLAAGARPAVCATEDDGRLVVALGCDAPERLDTAAVRRTLAARYGLSRAAVRVVAVTALPRTGSGKPDLRAVAALAGTEQSGAGAPAADAPTGLPADEAEAVRGVFARVLERPDASWQDSFVSLRGDSLSFVELSVQLEEVVGDLPRGWHLMPIAELVPARPPARRRTRAVEVPVLLRALAIITIAASHIGLFSLQGGAHVLLVACGLGFARFQLGTGQRRARVRRVLGMAARVAVPAVLWLAVVVPFSSEYTWPNAVLLRPLLGDAGVSGAWDYWFLEALTWTLLGLALLLAVPAFHRAERRWPFAVPVALALAGLATRYELVDLTDRVEHLRAHVVFWLFALGWAAARAERPWQRGLVSVLVAATVPGLFPEGDLVRTAVVVLGTLALVWVPQVRVPRLLVPVLTALASASLWIYLTHWQVYPALAGHSPLLALAASLAAGVLAWRGVDAGERVLRRATTARRPHAGGPAARNAS